MTFRLSLQGFGRDGRAGRLIALVVWLLLGCAPCPEALAQTASLRGFVTDADNGEPLELVNAALAKRGRIVRGVATNRDGLFVMSDIPAGRYLFQATFVGYRPFADSLIVRPGDRLLIDVALAFGDARLGELLVESERIGGAANITAGQQTVRPADIELIPAPDLSADLAGLLTALPGVVSVGDRGGRLFIRGGEPSQNLVQVDGAMVYQPFHILGFYSAFPADLLNTTDIYAGGFGSKFGERISSVIDVSTRAGNNRSFAGSVTLSPFISAARLEGPIVPHRWSFLLSARESLVDGGASRIIGEDLPFSFGDVFAKVSGQLGPSGRLSGTILRTHDRGTIARDLGAGTPDEIRWRNFVSGIRLVAAPAITPVMVDLRASYSSLPTELGPRDDPTRKSSVENFHIAADATFFGSTADVDVGADVRLLSITSVLGGLYQNLESRSERLEHVAVYLEPEFRFAHGLEVRPGVRVQFFDTRFAPFIEPRLRAVWRSGRHRLSGSMGLYHQTVLGLNDRRDAASVFTAWTSVPRENPANDSPTASRVPRAAHGILGYAASLGSHFELSVEGFYRKLSNLLIAEWTAFPRFTTRLQPASGRSYGLDVRAEFRSNRLYGYVTYGLSSTRYDAEQVTLELWYGQETLSFRPPHDRRHQVNALVSTSISKLDVSMRWEFGSGLPFSRAIGFDGFALVNDVTPAPDVPGSRRVIYERPFRGILPTYHRMDFSVARSFRAGSADVTVQASVINLYDRRNIFYLDVFTLTRVDQLPLVPSISLRIEYN